MESKVCKLSFSVEGSFITEISREWFWIEDKPYSVCEDLLLSCLVTDQLSLEDRKRLVVEILEGRKKLVGTNSLTVEDDNEVVRPLSLKIEQQEDENGILWITERMDTQAIDFVDPYSTIKSIKAIRDSDRIPKHSFLDCLDWFTRVDSFSQYPEYDSRFETCATKLGLWLFFKPEIAWKATKKRSVAIGSNEFWDNVYEQVKDWEPDQSFRERNQRYLADRRLSNTPVSLSSVIEKSKEVLEGVVESEDEESEKGLMARVALAGIEHSEGEDGLLFVTTPDDYIKWEGLISPKGDFYSCIFGGHNVKAYHIIKSFPEQFPGAREKMKEVFCDCDNALDFLLESGWCATRYLPSSGEYIDIPPLGSGKRPTKAQIDAIWEAVVRHDVKPYNLSIIDL